MEGEEGRGEMERGGRREDRMRDKRVDEFFVTLVLLVMRR